MSQVRLVSGLWNGSCPECGGGHTCHEGNALGHSVGCSLKPERIISDLLDALDYIAGYDVGGYEPHRLSDEVADEVRQSVRARVSLPSQKDAA